MNRLSLFNPNRDVFLRDWDSFFNDAFWGAPVEREFSPATDIEETDSHFLMSFDVPGLSKGDLSVEVEGDLLTVSGERKAETEDRREGVHRRERRYGKFTRSFRLPSGVDSSRIEAEHKDGVLHLAIPKTAELQRKRIEVKSGEEGFVKKFFAKKAEPKLAS